MPRVRSYRDLAVWGKAMDLVVEVYRSTQEYPSHEQFGLTSQTRRVALSIPANIAEGHARKNTREFWNFLSIALGSLAELGTHLELATRLDYLDERSLEELLDAIGEIGKMMHGILRSLPTNH